MNPALEHPAPSEQDALFRDWLQQRPRTCPNCQYALVGLTHPVCPECGVRLVLAVRSAYPRTRSYLAGLIGLSAGLGFSGFMGLLQTLFMILGDRGGQHPTRFLVLAFGGAIVFGVLACFWHHRRRDFRRLSTSARILLALGAWLLSIAYVPFFALLLN